MHGEKTTTIRKHEQSINYINQSARVEGQTNSQNELIHVSIDAEYHIRKIVFCYITTASINNIHQGSLIINNIKHHCVSE